MILKLGRAGLLTRVEAMDANIRLFETELAAREPAQQNSEIKLHSQTKVENLATL